MTEEPETDIESSRDQFPAFQKPAFTRKYLEDQKNNPNKDRTIFSVSLNAEQKALVDKSKTLLQLEGDSSTLKALAELGGFVLHCELGHFFAKHFAIRAESLKYRIKTKKQEL